MRYLHINAFSLITLSLLLSGCSTNSPHLSVAPFTKEKNLNTSKNQTYKTPATTTPSWFSTFQTNTDNYLYGFGSGKTLDNATKNALADMTQRLQVTVSALTNFEKITNNNNISQKLVQQVTTQSAKINIPKYTIINQEKAGEIFYIELQINKENSIDNLKNIISDSIHQALQLLNTTDNKSSIYRLNVAQKVDNLVENITDSLRTLVILAPNSDINSQMDTLNSINNQLLNLKRTIKIYIDKQNSGFFYDSLKKHLRIYNYDISMQKDEANIYIYLKLIHYHNFFTNKKYCINTQVELQASDNTSNQLLPKTYIIKTCSEQGRTIAIDNAVEIFYSQLNNAESIY